MSTFLQKFNDTTNTDLTEAEKQSIALLSSICLDQISLQPKPKLKEQQIECKVIETTQQFLTWFSEIELEMAKGQDGRFDDFMDTINHSKNHIDSLIQEIQNTQSIIEELQNSYEFVGQKTSGLQLACEALLDEQAHMYGISEEISQKLAYFNHLETITKQLNMPGDQIVLEKEFIPMLEKLDQCLSFVIEHSSFKDADLYHLRYRQCMTRAMTLIKLYFVESVRYLQSEIKEKLKLITGDIPSNVQLSLFYVKFRSLASKTKVLVQELELRCPSHQEYFQLLRDCINAYVNVRKQLLTPIVTENIKKTTGVQHAINVCSYMLTVCMDEYSLFKEFFGLGDQEVRQYLESFASILYYQLRPFILKENRIDVLSDLCNQLLYLMNSNETKRLEPVEFVIETILNDAQSRLTFRAQDIIHSEIRAFRPREQELLILARGPGLPPPLAVTSVSGVSEVLENEIMPRRSSTTFSPAIEAALERRNSSQISVENVVGGGEWYPTVQRTMSVLSKLYGCVPTPSFDDLAQDAVESCRASIMSASEILKMKMTLADGLLFAIKNLMQLREHISMYDSNFTRSTRNLHISDVFSALKDVIVHPLVLQKYGNLVLPFLQTQEDDVRQLLDADLKKTCETYILDIAKLISDPLIQFLNSTNSKNGIDSQFAATVPLVYKEFLTAIQTNLDKSIKMMQNYFGDKNTLLTLIRLIRSTILSQYNDFLETVKKGSAQLAKEVGTEEHVAKLLDDIVEKSVQ